MLTRTLGALGLAAALATSVTACGGVAVTARPGYVYYDSYGSPYTYQAYNGGYRTAYIAPQYVEHRGGGVYVAPGASYYYQRPPPGYWEGHGGGGVQVVGPRVQGGVQVNAPPPRGGVVVNGR